MGTILNTLSAERGKICTSLIIPVKDSPREGAQNRLLIDKAIKKAVEELTLKLGIRVAKEYFQKLNRLKEKIDYTRLSQGVGLFVSDNVAESVLLNHPVDEKIIVNDHFETRDLIFSLQNEAGYLLLGLSEKEVRLFKGRGRELEEIKNKKFPKKYEETYEYDEPFALQGIEGYSAKTDVSIVEQKRIGAYFRSADKDLDEYISINTPLIVSGIPKEISMYKKVTSHSKNIVAEIPGNYLNDINRLEELSGAEMQKHLQQVRDTALTKYINKAGTTGAVAGIRDVWKAAKEGKGMVLLVEKDFKKSGFTGKDEYKMMLRPPSEPHTIIPDAVNDIIETVIEKGGEVVYVDNGKLKDYQGIGLILRYA